VRTSGPLRFHNLAAGEAGTAGVADLALVNEVGEGGEGLLDRGVRLGPVNLVQVDVVSVQPTRELSTSRIQRRELPQWFGSSDMALRNLVVSTRRTRPPVSALPIISSDSPPE